MSSFDESDAFEGASLAARAMAARPAPYLDGLNPEQRLAVETMDGPVLMLAGAGTGKTKALTTRIVHLLNTGRAQPNEVLAVTFTNKAAREMKNRVGGLLGERVEGMPWLGTFHSICVKLLRRHAELICVDGLANEAQTTSDPNRDVLEDPAPGPYDQGPVPQPPAPRVTMTQSSEICLKSNFTILDTDDQLRLLKQLIRAEGIDDKRWPARMLAGIIDHWKNRAWGPDAIPAAEAGAYDGKGPAIYAQYQRRLIELNAVDFGDLLMHVVTIFQTHPNILQRYQRWFKYILVDEYQDTNVAQYLWLRLLAGGHKNICCVGDDDQSIYGWRGAEVGNILRFEKDFPGAHVVRLEQNYRSTPHILAAASGVIAGNKGRLGKELWTEATEGEKVRLIGHWDGDEEARWIGEEIEAMQRGTRGRDALGLDSMAILVRASHQMRAFEDRFLTIGLPYRVIGGPRFYERLEIRDAMAYFRITTSPTDDLAFERIVNTPKRGLGDKAQQTIQRIARENGTSLLQGAHIAVETGAIKGKGATELGRLIDGLTRWARMAGSADLSHMELAEIILDESGYTEMWQNDKTPEAPGRLENLKELVKALEAFENLTGFLEHVSLIMDNEAGEDGEKVSIMTLHAAKGLEFPAVFLPGWEDGLFPSQRSMDESGTKGVEEERRLAYVGITRAEEVCTISFAGNRRVFGQWQSSLPSRFIDELPEAHVEVLTPPGLYGGGFGAAGMESTIDARVADADVYNSPGWRRMQARASQRPTAEPSETRHAVIDMNAVSTHTVGERVFHDKFGYGEVMAIEGDKLEIAFEKAGLKKVVARFIVGAEDVPF
ncbi:UvrD-helicase domain-containing protein [Roseovarius sp. LXJ103]|uniref:ATP-dependent helicase n=1 Tax=Roseovarius carneus TaxID=2853164 RepID=UPI000D605FF3|nr:UvrD-helicase domain-containing protein [Roseovarius carneus]MBZ8119052.1 UvrD-helicase domain-containing protein [Roseovarius carneus]PWE35300.1 DNA helicase II [Pelagicola sp. LXJ1103]